MWCLVIGPTMRSSLPSTAPLLSSLCGTGRLSLYTIKMIDHNELYASWMAKGSYFNLMIDCGDLYNQWVENALRYLPPEILDANKEKLVFISTAQTDACRVARNYCENREVIFLSERILPKLGASEGQPKVRYFIFTVVHEVAHAIKKHKSPKFDNLSEVEIQAQEDEADKMALDWFNQYIVERNNKYLKPLTPQEIKIQQDKNIELMEKLHTGV